MTEPGSGSQADAPLADPGPHGSWPSPISAALVAAGGTKITEVKATVGEVWWLETRPVEQGRAVVISAPLVDPSARRDRLPAGWSSRNRVHEYGGGSWWLGADRLYFVSADDQRLHSIEFGGRTDAGATGEPRAITPDPDQPAGWSYADGQEHPDGSIVVCVREDHHRDGEPANEIVAIPVAGGDPIVLVGGADFYLCPRISPDGRWLCWVQWDHPNMPWQKTTLKVAPLFGNGSERRPVRLGNVQTVADGFAVHGADWTADGRLIYSSDEPGYWNLYWWTEGTGGRLTSLTGSEIGYPPWIFGVQRWADLGDGRLAVIVTSDAVDGLMVVAADGSLSAFQPSPSAGGDGIERAATVNIESLTAVQDEGEPSVAMIAATPTSLPEIRAVPVDGGSTTVIRPSDSIGVDASWLSVPTSMWFDSDGRATQAFLYLPPAATEEPPPLIVIGHGGPTAHASPALNLKIQYWTSRGFAVADVNYGGSTGFGRDYRNRLHEAWGLVDVDDCVNAARHLADSGVVNGDRMAIRGSSAGGLTVLLALLRGDCFATGVSLYGVTDLTDLAADTHKFERHYMDWLVGPYPATIERYIERSPSSRLDDLDTPMLLMQGTDDKVVPPSQSEKVVEGLKAKNLPHLYVTFDGEGHGFRQATSLIASLEVELWFYGSIFGFEPADRVGVPESAVGFGLAGSDGPGPQHRP